MLSLTASRAFNLYTKIPGICQAGIQQQIARCTSPVPLEVLREREQAAEKKRTVKSTTQKSEIR
jgi:hypothetical protein